MSRSNRLARAAKIIKLVAYLYMAYGILAFLGRTKDGDYVDGVMSLATALAFWFYVKFQAREMAKASELDELIDQVKYHNDQNDQLSKMLDVQSSYNKMREMRLSDLEREISARQRHLDERESALLQREQEANSKLHFINSYIKYSNN